MPALICWRGGGEGVSKFITRSQGGKRGTHALGDGREETARTTVSFCDTLLVAHGECCKNFLLILQFTVMKSPGNTFFFSELGEGEKKHTNLFVLEQRSQTCRQGQAEPSVSADPGGQPACLQSICFPLFKETVGLGRQGLPWAISPGLRTLFPT